MENQEYLDKYEDALMQKIAQMCVAMQVADKVLASSPDIDDRWEQIALPYMGDAVKEFEKYPTVSLGWAMYVGMAVAHCWDAEWEKYSGCQNLYETFRDVRGFDCMDEYIREDILQMKDEEYGRCEELVRICSEKSLDTIRHEQVEPGSPMAFHVYVRSIKVLYKLGAAIELKRLGYKMEKQ